jgi:hypothetical protein
MDAAKLVGLSTILALFLVPQIVVAQAIGEYGRTLGGVNQRQGSASLKASRPTTQNTKGKGNAQGVGNVGGRPVPSALIVTSKQATLYPRQDEEAEKIEELSEGEALIPIVQSNGGNEWYMVKTSKGLIGWVKSADVRDETVKKQ